MLFFVLLPFNLLLFPARAERLRAFAGGNGPVLDARFGYSPAEAYAYFAVLGSPGRMLYGITQATLDVAYPVLYSLLLSGLLALVLARAYPGRRGIAWLALIPFGMALMDLSENLSILCLLFAFPTMPVWLAHMASAFTVEKWLLGGAGASVLVIGLVVWAFRAVRMNAGGENGA